MSTFPSTAASLLVQGRIFSMMNLVGEGEPDLHPAVRQFFDTLSAELREPYIGYCAESALVSDQFWGLDESRGDGRSTTLEEGAPHFAGALVMSRKIREQGDPEHGEVTLPCRSCTALLDRLGVGISRP
ncbi:YwqJ-related putative deaminase [Streptomyces sp. NPDC021100]|uniref:YwqJ-related putative deaminase n=1 Tax=Streptomyces sp. NPDC021100 TaxID=3365114 RepID=UPI0037B29139